jgi:hypothetical protein
MDTKEDSNEKSNNKEYQTLFWVPMLFQTAHNAERYREVEKM